MATVTKPMALDESFNTTENTSRNVADVLAEGLSDIADAISPKYATDLPMSTTEPNSMVADRIEDMEYSAGEQMSFAFHQLFCRIDSSGKRISVFIPMSKIIKASTVTASGAYSVYDINGNSLLSNHDISNDTQASTITHNGIIMTITLTTALSVTLGYGAIELRNTFLLTFA